MDRNTHRLIYIVLLFTLVTAAYALNYQYFSENEQTVFGDVVRFWGLDTLHGPLRSNDVIHIMQNPPFYDYVISSAADFGRGIGFNPSLSLPPYFNAPEIYLPDDANWYRGRAEEQDFYFDPGENMQARVQLFDHAFRASWAAIGAPFDTTEWDTVALADSAIVFFECPIRISGRVHSKLVVAAVGLVGLEDNILYASSAGNDGHVTPGHPERFALISEGEMKVLNTPQNGRENSAGLGNNQPDQDLTSIALNGMYVALLGNFTFENQNDPDSGYVCTCMPDDRGIVYLWGGLYQQRRGYMHRSTRSSTGYLKQYRYDNDLRHWNIGLFDLRENVIVPSSLDFGDVLLGETAVETLTVYNDYVPLRLGGFTATSPFAVVADSLTDDDSTVYDFQYEMLVTFSPTSEETFESTVQFGNNYYDTTFVIPIRGTGVVLDARDGTVSPREFSLSVYPNPFNASAQIRIVLPNGQAGELQVFDLLGREVARWKIEAGVSEHLVSFDGSGLSTGIYLAVLRAETVTKTEKLLLLK